MFLRCRYKIGKVSAAIFGIFVLTSCSPALFEWQYKELSRIKAPGGQAEAVTVTGDAGAATRTETLVLVVRAGKRCVIFRAT